MTTQNAMIITNKYSNEILEVIELQLRNNEDSLTQSDLQGRVDAIVMNILNETKGYK